MMIWGASPGAQRDCHQQWAAHRIRGCRAGGYRRGFGTDCHGLGCYRRLSSSLQVARRRLSNGSLKLTGETAEARCARNCMARPQLSFSVRQRDHEKKSMNSQFMYALLSLVAACCFLS
jgi:hypothetical protein